MQIQQIKTQRLLSKTQIDLADFVINPYRGCSFGCIYCYSQKNKNIQKKKKTWGSFLDVKINAAGLLKKELQTTRPRKVMLGSTTECFLPQEEKFRITESILKILKQENIPLVILTKSSIIEGYMPLIDFHPENKVYFTFMFSDETIKNLFERNTPHLQQRIKAIERLCQGGIKVKIHIGPFIPYLEDLRKLFDRIPPQIQEVEIEVYNSRMGNLKDIIKIVKDKISSEKAEEIQDVYSSRQNYYDFCRQLQTEAEKLNRNYNFKINFIIPEFDSWYTDKIKYE